MNNHITTLTNLLLFMINRSEGCTILEILETITHSETQEVKDIFEYYKNDQEKIINILTNILNDLIINEEIQSITYEISENEYRTFLIPKDSKIININNTLIKDIKDISIGKALLMSFAITGWAFGIALSVNNITQLLMAIIFPPIGWVLTAQWIIETFK